MRKVKKAIIPAAGYGTRFLPVTKTSPKEMLPIVDKPVIQFVVEEAVEAGIEEVIFITNSNKRAVEDYFDYIYELEEKLKNSGKNEQYQMIRAVSDIARFAYVRQKEPRGTGHALLQVENLVGDEPFLVLWGDEFFDAKPGRSKQLVEVFQKTGSPVLALFETAQEADTYKYAYVETSQDKKGLRVTSLVEKPGPEKVPSNLASVGGHLLTPEIFPLIHQVTENRGEIVLADALGLLAKTQPVYGCVLHDAVYYDSGSKFGFIKANIEYGLRHPETKDELLAYLESLRNAR